MEGGDSAVSFSIELDHPVPGVAVVRIHGDIDFMTASDLRAAIAEQLISHPPQLIIDLDDVTFLDTAGLAELVHARTTRPDLRIVCSDARPLRALEISGLRDWFHVTASVTAAFSLDRTDDRLEPA